MSKPTLFLALALLLAASVSCGRPKELGPYVNPAQGFAIAFPPNWEVSENQLGLAVIGLAPLEGPSDLFRENVTVSAAEMKTPLAAAAILDGNIPAMINMVTDFKPEGRGVKTIGDREAAWMRYSQRQGRFNLTVTVFAVPGNKHGYLIHCTAETSAVERFQKPCDQVVESFKVIE